MAAFASIFTLVKARPCNRASLFKKPCKYCKQTV
jgi:hypothetical protein